MCRGCEMKINGTEATNEYISFLDDYLLIIQRIKALNLKILTFENSVDGKADKKRVSRFRRRLIMVGKEFAKADALLNKDATINKGEKAI